MKEVVKGVLRSELAQIPLSISEIVGFGTVNNVFDVACQAGSYVIRLNKEEAKRLEFIKEEWCIREVKKLGVLSPNVISNGAFNGIQYMIQEKLGGVNGSTCSKDAKKKIWEELGGYALKYHSIGDIAIPALKEAEFHDDWRSKLEYNIDQLNSDDALFLDGAFSLADHSEIRRILISLREKDYSFGLVHGDLSPRNTIVNDATTYLIDWGTASVNVVPHNELGILLMEGEADREEFKAFLKGMGIAEDAYKMIELDVWKLNLLHRLDKYRWATDNDVDDILDFTTKIKSSFESVLVLDRR